MCLSFITQTQISFAAGVDQNSTSARSPSKDKLKVKSKKVTQKVTQITVQKRAEVAKKVIQRGSNKQRPVLSKWMGNSTPETAAPAALTQTIASPQATTAPSPQVTAMKPPVAKKPVETGFGFPEISLSYEFMQNVVQERDPKISSHRMGFDVETKSKGTTTYILSTGFRYHYDTIGSEVDDSPGAQDLEDFDISASMSKELSAKSNWSLGLASSFPLSQASQFEGYKAVPSLSAGISYQATSWYTLNNSLTLGYIVNEFDYSPTSDGDKDRYQMIKDPMSVNPDYFVTYVISQKFKMSRIFSLTIPVGAKHTHYLDGSTNEGIKFNSGIELAANYMSWAMTAKYSAGGFANTKTDEFWYIDGNRQIVSLGISYAF